MQREFHGGEFIVMGVPGPELDAPTRADVEEIQPGGFILFSRNIKEPAQLRRLIDDLRGAVRHEPIITIDQEGGRVSRLREMGAEPPSAKQLRDRGDLELIKRHGDITGRLLRLFGFNLDLCPVLDISFDDEADNSLKGRTYGRTPEQVTEYAGAFNDGLRAQGILSCGKHFPGYSAAGVDPHHELPRIERTRAELEACEWIPFRSLLTRLDTVMIGHAVYPHIDPSELPTSLAPRIIEGILREEMGFPGVVISDDLDMGAILNYCDFDTSMQRAVQAGNDYILLCHRVTMARQAKAALARLPYEEVAASLERIANVQKRLPAPAPFSIEAWKTLDDEVTQLRVETLGDEAKGKKSAEDGKRSPVELY